jgi:hypothetical protein
LSAFYDYIDEILGAADDVTDIVCTARKCWFYDFKDEPVRLWDGQGNFTDSDGNEWLGTMNAEGGTMHKTPSLQDGRDGTSATYTFSFNIPQVPGEDILALYEGLKSEQDKVYGRKLTCYIVIFKEGEGLRPGIPISFYKELIMFSPLFSEQVARNADGTIVKTYTASIKAKDNNNGRSETPNRTYADTMQKRRATELGVTLDRGCEYLALLANRTYTVP